MGSAGMTLKYLNELEDLFHRLRIQGENSDETSLITREICKLLGSLRLLEVFSLSEAISLCKTLVSHFFCFVKNEGSSEIRSAILNALGEISQHSLSTRSFTIRSLVENAVRPPASKYLGAMAKLNAGNNAIKSYATAEEEKRNARDLLAALHSCCVVGPYSEADPQIAMILSLLLVELVSPDIMFNGLPWPPLETCKITIERDVAIRRSFDSAPILWVMLRFLALQRPALCLSSVLLRAITATLFNDWTAACQGRLCMSGPDDPVIRTTLNLLEVLQISQLLPFPLFAMSHVIPHIPPEHVLPLLRECVWNYMEINVPSPTLFSNPRDVRSEEDLSRPNRWWRDLNKDIAPQNCFVERFKNILLYSAQHFGELYYQLFVAKKLESSLSE